MRKAAVEDGEEEGRGEAVVRLKYRRDLEGNRND